MPARRVTVGNMQATEWLRAGKAWARYVLADLREKGYSKREVLAGEVEDLPPPELRLLRVVEGWRP